MLVTVDTGATKTLVAEFGKDGKIGEVIKFPTPVSEEEYVAVLSNTLQKKYEGKTVDAVVIALPGIVKDGVAVWCNNLGWTNFDAGKAFTGVLGKTPVLIENDANLGGLGEVRAHESAPVSALYVTISTGIGTGVITSGRIDPGLRHSEGGRSLVEFEGNVREWESFASGKAIHKAYNQFGRDITSEKTWNQIADRISRGFLAIIPFIQPDVIILGGSMGTHFKKYHVRLEEILKENLPPHIPCPQIVEAQHPEEAVIYGCYYYALDYLADK